MNENTPEKGLFGKVILIAVSLVLISQTLHFRLGGGAYDYGLEFLLRFYHVDGAGQYVVKHLLTNSYYPPLYFAILLVTWLGFGTSFLAHVLTGDVLIIGGAYLLYRWLLLRGVGEKVAGLCAAAYLLLPGVTVFARTLLIEQPMMFLLPACLLFLEQSGGFTKRKSSAVLGVFLGLGLLTKWSFGVYLIVPFVVAFWKMFQAKREEAPLKTRLLNVLLMAGVVLLVSGWWYFGVFDFQRMATTAANDPTFAEPDFLLHLQHNIWLLQSLASRTVFWFIAGAFVILLIIKSSRRKALYGIAAIAVPIILFSFPAHLEDRYLYPLLIFLPLFVVGGRDDKKFSRVFLSLGVLFIAFALFANVNSYLPSGPLVSPKMPRKVATKKLDWRGQHTDKILEQIAGHASRHEEKSVTIAVHPLWHNLHCTEPVMLHESRNMDYGPQMEVKSYSKFSYHDYSESLETGELDYIVLDCATPGVCSDDPQAEMKLLPHDRISKEYIDQRYGTVHRPYTEVEVASDLAMLRKNYSFVCEVGLGDGLRVWVYHNNRRND